MRTILAILAGAVIGAVVNGGIVALGPSIIPPPPGADVTTMEGLRASMHLFGPQNFLMPWLAHAIGTLVGALVAAKIATTGKRRAALIVGALFLVGGIANVMMLPSPLWFTIVDLAGAYMPMAYAGSMLAGGKSQPLVRP